MEKNKMKEKKVESDTEVFGKFWNLNRKSFDKSTLNIL